MTSLNPDNWDEPVIILIVADGSRYDLLPCLNVPNLILEASNGGKPVSDIHVAFSLCGLSHIFPQLVSP